MSDASHPDAFSLSYTNRPPKSIGIPSGRVPNRFLKRRQQIQQNPDLFDKAKNSSHTTAA